MRVYFGIHIDPYIHVYAGWPLNYVLVEVNKCWCLNIPVLIYIYVLIKNIVSIFI